MNIIKINQTTAELRTDYGSLLRVIAQDIIYAEINPINQNMILLTRTDGRVDLVDEFGATIRNIVMSGATLARFNGYELAITKQDGKIEIRDIYGAMLRMV